MYRLSYFAMDDWKSDIKCQSIISEHGMVISHGDDVRTCDRTSRDLPYFEASEDTNKLCDAVSLSLGLNLESDNYGMDQPSTSRAFTENVRGEDSCVHASLELSETGKSTESATPSHFRCQREDRRSVVTNSSGLVETVQRNRHSPPFDMATLQLAATDTVITGQQRRVSGIPLKPNPSMHRRNMDESDVTQTQFESLLTANIRQHGQNRNPFPQNSGVCTTASVSDSQPASSVRRNWDSKVPVANYSAYDLFLRNCNDYTLRGAPLSFSGYFPDSFYSGGMYGRIPATASIHRPCEWTAGPNGLASGFR